MRERGWVYLDWDDAVTCEEAHDLEIRRENELRERVRERVREQVADANHAICKLGTCPNSMEPRTCTQAARNCFQFLGAEFTGCPLRSLEDINTMGEFANSHPKCAVFTREMEQERRKRDMENESREREYNERRGREYAYNKNHRVDFDDNEEGIVRGRMLRQGRA